jgi:type II secretory pathway pseudopilin PulG
VDNKVLIIGGVIAAGVLLVLYSKNKTTQLQNQAYLQNQQLQQQAAYQNSTAGQVGGILSSVGSLFGSGSVGSLFQSFGSTSSYNNDPGLDDADDNDPGFVDSSTGYAFA